MVKHLRLQKRQLGFLFKEKSRRPFLDDQAEVLGVPRGPVASAFRSIVGHFTMTPRQGA